LSIGDTETWAATDENLAAGSPGQRYRPVLTLPAPPSPWTAVVRNAGEPIVPPVSARAFDVPAMAIELAGIALRLPLAGGPGSVRRATSASSALSLCVG
jgi:hypothetical protein